MSEYTEIEILDVRIDTTIGDLICAIHDVIGESTDQRQDETEVAAYAQLILDSLRFNHEVRL